MGADETPAALIRELREQAGSHDKFAALIGGAANRQTIIGWERGRVPSAHYARRLSEISGRPAEDFRTGSRAAARQAEERLARLVQASERAADRLEALLSAAEDRLGAPPPPRPGR